MRLYVAVCLAFFLTRSEVLAEHRIPEDQLALARYVLAGFRAGRGELRTGAFGISGTRVVKSAARNIDHVAQIEGLAAFDVPGNRFRFERKEPSSRGDLIDARFIKRDDMVINRQLWSPSIDILSPNKAAEPFLRAFDIRTAGICNRAEFELNTSVDKLLGEFLPESRLLEASQEGELYRLCWQAAGGDLVRNVWFDPRRGFCPVRLESRFAALPDAEPLEIGETRVILKNGVWVPETLLMHYKSRRGEEKIIAYALDWRSVNQPLEDEVFSVEALKGPNDETRVVDYRLGQPVVVYDPFGPPPVERPARRSTAARVVAAALATVLLLGGVMLFTIRARRAQRSR